MSSQPITIGILEEWPVDVSGEIISADDKYYIRPVFYWDGQVWGNVPEMVPTPKRWYLYPIADVGTTTPIPAIPIPDSQYEFQKKLEIVATQDVPRDVIACARSSQYGRWNSFSVRPPVVVLSVPTKAREMPVWMMMPVSSIEKCSVLFSVYATYSKELPLFVDPLASLCGYPPYASVISVDISYHLNAKKRGDIYGVSLVTTDDDILNDISTDYPAALFVPSGNQSVNVIGTNHNFLTTGDFNADGSEEMIFCISGYNEDGYALFSEKGQHLLTMRWSYH
jgi:hypothetical protein